MNTAKMMIICTVIIMLVVICVYIITKIAKRTYNQMLRYEEKVDIAQVCYKELEEEYLTLALNGTLFRPKSHRAEYNVYLKYCGEVYCLENKKMYDELKQGDYVHIIVHRGYDKEKVLKRIFLTAIE